MKGAPKDFHTKETKLSPLCHVTSGEDGSFVFPVVPTGSYFLVCNPLLLVPSFECGDCVRAKPASFFFFFLFFLKICLSSLPFEAVPQV